MGSKPWNEPMTNADELLTDSGGGNRDRTDDLLHAMQALSQLSYTPTQWQPTPMAHHPKCPPPQSEPQIISRLSAVSQTRQYFFAPHEFEQRIGQPIERRRDGLGDMQGAFGFCRGDVSVEPLRPVCQRHGGVAAVLEQGADPCQPAVGQFLLRYAPPL